MQKQDVFRNLWPGMNDLLVCLKHVIPPGRNYTLVGHTGDET
jgi:hypothetical protein